MRIASCLLLIPLCCIAAAEGAEAPFEFARKVQAAYDAGDTERLSVLARDDSQDPWLVADDLCLNGFCDAAMVYAKAAERQDAARLPAYLEKRKTAGHLKNLRAAVLAATRAKTPEDRRAALTQLDAQRGRGDPLERVLVELSRGNVLNNLDEDSAAAETFLRAGREAAKIGWLPMAARVYAVAGLNARHDNDFETMQTAWTRLLAIEQGRGNRTGTGRALIYLGLLHYELGDFDRSLQFLGQAEKLFTQLGDANRTAWALNNLGMILRRRGEYGRAQDVLLRGLKLARQAKNMHRVAAILSNLGALHSKLWDLERSIEYHEQALTIFTARKERRGVAECTGNIGIVYRMLGEYDKALDYTRRALAAFRDLEIDSQIVTGLVSLGIIQREQKRLDDAKKSLVEAVAIAHEARTEYDEVHALQCLASVFTLRGEHDAAQTALDQSMRISTRMASPRLLAANHRLQAELWLARKQPDRAVIASERALEYSMAQLVGLAPDQAALARDGLATLFQVSLDAAVAWGRPEAVFASIEGSRAGALLESLENRNAIRSEYVSKALRERELDATVALKTEARAYQKAVANGNRPRVRLARRALDDARERLHAVVGLIQREARAAASLLYPEPVTMEEGQLLLGAHEALVAYSVISTAAIALVVTAKDARIVDLGPRELVLEAAGARLDDPAQDVAARVAQMAALLVEPLKLPSDVRRLFIAPDGILGYVPFALLVGDREVAYVPSASAYRTLRESGAARGTGVLALGDPDYKTHASEKGVPQRGGMHLSPLPATRKEAQAIGDVVLLDDKATTGRFLMSVKTRKRWRAIHLACHGRVDTERPMRSALALAIDKDGSSLLTCGTVFEQRFPTDLAVLSACETGRGTVHRVEGIVGLTQAFMLAGAPRVLVSLWKVDDEATQALMVEFYRLWNGDAQDGPKRIGAAEALRRAQAHVRKQEKWKHPYYWAAFVLWGLPD